MNHGGAGYIRGEGSFVFEYDLSTKEPGGGGGSIAGAKGGNPGYSTVYGYTEVTAGGGGGASIGDGGDGAIDASSSQGGHAAYAGVYGGGGGGGSYNANSVRNGAAGGKGIVIIEW